MTSLNIPHNCNRNDELLFSSNALEEMVELLLRLVVVVDVGWSCWLLVLRNNASSRLSSISLARPSLVCIDSDDDDDDAAPFDSCEEDVKAGLPPPS